MGVNESIDCQPISEREVLARGASGSIIVRGTSLLSFFWSGVISRLLPRFTFDDRRHRKGVEKI